MTDNTTKSAVQEKQEVGRGPVGDTSYKKRDRFQMGGVAFVVKHVADDDTMTIQADGVTADEVDAIVTSRAALEQTIEELRESVASMEAQIATLKAYGASMREKLADAKPPTPTGKYKTIVQKLHSEDAIARADAEIEQMEAAGYRIASEQLGGPMQRVIRFVRADDEHQPDGARAAVDDLPDEAQLTATVNAARGVSSEPVAAYPPGGDARITIIGTDDGPDVVPDYLKSNFAAFFLTRVFPNTDLTPSQAALISSAWTRWETAVRLSEVAS